MKKLFWLILALWVLLPIPLHAQTPDASRTYTFTDTTPNGWINLKGSGVQYHQLVWYPASTGVTACMVKLEYSADGVTADGDLIADQDCTSIGGSTVATQFANYVRINPDTKTGAGAVTVRYIGRVLNAAGGATVTANAGTGVFKAAPWGGGTFKAGVITSAMTATTSTQVIAGVASNYLYISACQFSNDHATVDTLMKLQDGSGGTALWEGMVPHGAGSNVVFPTPLKVPTLGNGLYTVNVTTGSSTYASCEGFYTTVSY